VKDVQYVHKKISFRTALSPQPQQRDQDVSVLSTKDLQGTADDWDKKY
jgi:hypothetical protein